MTGAVECRYYGRDFTPEEMALLRAGRRPPRRSTAMSCRRSSAGRIGWFKPDGGLAKTRHRGLDRVGWMSSLTEAAYNLVRLRESSQTRLALQAAA